MNYPHHPTKLNVSLTNNELALAKELAGLLQRPGQPLSAQDVLRIALANLGLIHLAECTTQPPHSKPPQYTVKGRATKPQTATPTAYTKPQPKH